MKHSGPGWENLVHWPIVARLLGPNPERWGEEVQGELFDKAIILALELHMNRAQFVAFLDRVKCVPIPEDPWILVITTPGYEKWFFRKAIRAYDATLLPAYERFLAEHGFGFIAEDLFPMALNWSPWPWPDVDAAAAASEDQEAGGGGFEYIPTLFEYRDGYPSPVLIAFRDEFLKHQGPGWENFVRWPCWPVQRQHFHPEDVPPQIWREEVQSDLFGSALFLALQLCMTRAQFVAFLDCVMCVPIPENRHYITLHKGALFFHKAIGAYDATLLPTYEQLLVDGGNTLLQPLPADIVDLVSDDHDDDD